jgi:uncharacterized protein (TIRG00374 family)
MGSTGSSDEQSIVPKRAILLAISKASVAAALIAFLFSKMNFDEVAALSDKKGAAFLILAIVLGVPLATFDSLNLSLVLRVLGYRLALRPALTYTMVGAFFSNLAPSTLGGDVFRAVQMNRVGVPLEQSVRMVVVARAIALSALFLVILLGLPLMLTSSLGRVSRIVTLACLMMAAVTLLVGLTADRIAWLRGSDLINRVTKISCDLRQVLFGSKFSFAVIGSAVLVHLTRVLIVYTIALALDAHLPLAGLFVVVPIALLVAMIPISFASWGIREVSFIYFLGQLGSSFGIALSISVLFGLHRALFGVIGGLVWIGARRSAFGIGLNTCAG